MDELYYDKTKKDYRYFTDYYVDSNPLLKKLYEDYNEKTPLSKKSFWIIVHDLEFNYFGIWCYLQGRRLSKWFANIKSKNKKNKKP